MQQFDQIKNQKFNIPFFSLKVLALFFGIAPVFQHFFTVNASSATFNLKATVIMLVMMIFITFMWLLMSNPSVNRKTGSYIEIAIFYFIYLIAICFSGFHQSYYKYGFIFMIVIYTIEFSMRAGIIISSICAATIMTLDIIFYKAPGVNPYFQSDITLSAMFFVVSVSLGFYVKVVNQHIEDLKEFANIDGLTGAYNHRYFHDALGEIFKNDPEAETPISTIMIDIDYFKNYNDLFGHQQGDAVLKEISNILHGIATNDDIVCRYGGEEFTVIFKGLSEKETLEKANIIRKKIADYPFLGKELMPDKNITVSIGVSGRKDKNDTPDDLIKRSDVALYRAKFFRKNRVELYASIFEQFKEYNVDNDEQIASIKSLITIINSRDNYTFNHTERVVQYCQNYADFVNMDIEDKKRLIFGAYMHDVGKINISKEILMSTERLTDEQWKEIKHHPEDSANIIKPLMDLNDVVPIVLQHHEHYDGSGYPQGLKGKEINPLARILSIADSFDAMTSSRPYQKPRTIDEAIEELERNKGIQFDPYYTSKFVEAIRNKLQ